MAGRKSSKAKTWKAKTSRPKSSATKSSATASTKSSRPLARSRSRPHGRERAEQASAEERPLAASVDHKRLVVAEVIRLEAELSALRAKVRELEMCVDIDALTEVFNRRGFNREFKRASAYVARYGGTVALVYIDLDGFKSVNDGHGHAAGDAVLKAIGSVLLASVRTSDMVARLGGDEFAVMLWNLSEQDALVKAAALEDLIAAHVIPWGGSALSVGASTGVALLSGREEPAAVLARADGAMYTRKAARRHVSKLSK
jgi:diguanylate cyclase (GGDEF)-like protein